MENGLCNCGCGQKTPLAKKTRNGLIKGHATKWLKGHKNRKDAVNKRKDVDKDLFLDKNRPFCACGCGLLVNKAKSTNNKRGIKKGDYYRYLEGHKEKTSDKRIDRITSATGCSIGKNNEIRIYDKEHPKVHPGRMIPEAHLIAEAALGKYLPEAVCVWHYDRNAANTKNLVVCQDKKYMQLLRQRLVAHENCGYANYRKCAYCKQYDDPINMVHHTIRGFRHRGCYRKRDKESSI